MTLRMLALKEHLDQSSERLFGTIALWAFLQVAFAVGWAVLSLFRDLGTIVVVFSILGALDRSHAPFAGLPRIAQTGSDAYEGVLPIPEGSKD